jgi:hypothetical protein
MSSHPLMQTDDLAKLNDSMAQSSSRHIFLLIFKQLCPPCINVHPTWMTLQNTKRSTKTMQIFALDQQNLSAAHSVIKSYKISGFPTILHLARLSGGEWDIVAYTGSDRELKSFETWVETSLANDPQMGGRNRRRKRKSAARYTRNRRGKQTRGRNKSNRRINRKKRKTKRVRTKR